MIARNSSDDAAIGLLSSIIGVFGGLAGIAVFFYWCQQSGYYGAFSVPPEQVGIVGTIGIQLSVPAAVVSVCLAMLIVLAVGIRLGVMVIRRRIRTKRWTVAGSEKTVAAADDQAGEPEAKSADHVLIAILMAGSLLTIALGVNAVRDWALWPLWKPLFGVLVATAFAAIGWRHARGRAQGRLLTNIVVGAITLGCMGFTVNAWCNEMGKQALANTPSKFGYFAGLTSPKACVTWLDIETVPYELKAVSANLPPRWRASQEFLLLGEANDRYTLYDFVHEKVYRVPTSQAQVERRPHSLDDTASPEPCI